MNCNVKRNFELNKMGKRENSPPRWTRREKKLLEGGYKKVQVKLLRTRRRNVNGVTKEKEFQRMVQKKDSFGCTRQLMGKR